jgi:hypothetical protein
MGVVTRRRNEKIMQSIRDADKLKLRVGFFPSAQYPDGTHVAYIASIQEFGCPQRSIPPRPFMRVTIANQRQQWKEIFSKGFKKAMKGEIAFHAVMDTLGLKASTDCQKTISLLTAPPLSELTMLLRKYKMDQNAAGKSMQITGAIVGQQSKLRGTGVDLSGVSDKPLIEPGPGGGLLIASLQYDIVNK